MIRQSAPFLAKFAACMEARADTNPRMGWMISLRTRVSCMQSSAPRNPDESGPNQTPPTTGPLLARPPAPMATVIACLMSGGILGICCVALGISLLPSPTPLPIVTATPQGEETNQASQTPLPTATRLPTQTPQPTFTLPPTATVYPTATSYPTSLPRPTATSVILPPTATFTATATMPPPTTAPSPNP
jgi:hypothetical protein